MLALRRSTSLLQRERRLPVTRAGLSAWNARTSCQSDELGFAPEPEKVKKELVFWLETIT